MNFKQYKLADEEKREYILGWPRTGEKWKPEDGIIDVENDVRLFSYGNGAVREPSDEYQFIFDYKGKVFNIIIEEKTENDFISYSLNVDSNYSESSSEFYKDENIIEALREAVKIFGNRTFYIGGRDKSEKIKIEF